MRKSYASHRRGSAFLALVGLVATAALMRAAPAGGCNSAPEAMLPAFVLKAAGTGTVADFASALAHAQVCAGFLVGRDRAGEITRAWHEEPGGPQVRLGDALGAFRTRHKGIVVEPVGVILLVRDEALDKNTATLDRLVSRFEIQDLPAIEAFRRAAAIIKPEVAQTGGYVGSYVGRPGDPQRPLEDLRGRHVTTTLQNVTLLNILIDLEGRAPGVVWMLTASAAADAKAGTPQKRGYDLRCFLPHGVQQPIADALQ